MNSPSISLYRKMAEASDLEVRRHVRLINRFSMFRLLALAGGGFLLWQTFALQKIWLTELCFFLVIVVFAWLVSRQSRYERSRRFYESLKAVNENEIDSILNHGNIYSDGSAYARDEHPYAADLDILGNASVYKLINRCSSLPGCEKLAQWLLSRAGNPVVNQRQEAVKELASDPSWKMKFQAVLLFATSETSTGEISGLLRYLQEEAPRHKPALAGYIKALPFIWLGAALAAVFFKPALIVFIVLVLVNAFLLLQHQGEVNKTERLIGRVGSTLSKYSQAIELLEAAHWKSDVCRRLQNELIAGGEVKLSKQMKRLAVLLGRLEYRLNMFIGPLLNLTLAWDLRQLLAIGQWKATNGHVVAGAFDVLAEMECLLSLAGVHINYPDWCFPRLTEDEHYTLRADALGHPLLREELRVTNDFSLENEHRIDIITGSNMAGKSTFLRTLGVNCVLAYTGAPVCASAMELTNMKIFTYMRIKDSLNESISTFRAELNRLQLLLQEVEQGEKLYFLIDEMLRGTNSADKYKGSKAIIEKLISGNAVGIVATHDLQISELEERYPDYVRNFYFDIHVEGQEMQFDYKLKHGACKTFNASLLLRQLGVEIDESEE